MRISCLRGDPGYQAWRECWDREEKITIFCDGEELKRAIVADEEAGFAEVQVTDEADAPVIRDSRIVTEVVQGKIEIRKTL